MHILGASQEHHPLLYLWGILSEQPQAVHACYFFLEAVSSVLSLAHSGQVYHHCLEIRRLLGSYSLGIRLDTQLEIYLGDGEVAYCCYQTTRILHPLLPGHHSLHCMQCLHHMALGLSKVHGNISIQY